MKRFANLEDFLDSLKDLAKNNYVQKAMDLLGVGDSVIYGNHQGISDCYILCVADDKLVNPSKHTETFFNTKFVNNPSGKNRPNYFLKINKDGLPSKVTKQDIFDIINYIGKTKEALVRKAKGSLNKVGA